MPFTSHDELKAFLQSLEIPLARRDIVSAELLEHVRDFEDDALVSGASLADATRDALLALGDPAVLRTRLEAVEPAFHFGPWQALGRGLSVAVALAVGAWLLALTPTFGYGEGLAGFLVLLVRGLPLLPIAILFTPPAVMAEIGFAATIPIRLFDPIGRAAFRPARPPSIYALVVLYVPGILAVAADRFHAGLGDRMLESLVPAMFTFFITLLVHVRRGIQRSLTIAR